MTRVVFLIGTEDKGGGLTEDNVTLLKSLAEKAKADVKVVIAVQGKRFAGREKNVKLEDIRSQRDRAIKEVNSHSPDYTFCFGRVAASCAFNRGSVVLSEYRRKTCSGEGIIGQVSVLDSLSRIGVQPGVKKWLAQDMTAVLNGLTETTWGDYTILQPDTNEWHKCPEEYRDMEAGSFIGFDLETYPGLDPWAPNARIRMAMFSNKEGRAHVVQAGPNSELPGWAVEILANPLYVKAGSNIAFDYRWCKRFGYDVESMWDTATAEHVIDGSDPYTDLKNLTFRYCPKLGDYSAEHRELVRQRGGWEHIEDSEMYLYAGADAEASYATALGQRKLLGLRSWELSSDLYPILAAMQERGMAIDLKENIRLASKMYDHLGNLRHQVREVLGPINPSSPPQLAKALATVVKGIDLRESQWKRALAYDGEEDGEPEDVSTCKQVLEREAAKHPILKVILEYRRWDKLHSAFVRKLRDDHLVKHGGQNFIHPSFLLSRTETYRLASSSPNAQQIPRKPKEGDNEALNIKRQFISRFDGGVLLNADYAQMEVRVAAMLSKDPGLMRAVANEDVHASTAALMLRKEVDDITEEERQAAKTIGFATLYGAGSRKIAQELGVPKERASGLIEQYFRAYPTLRRFIQTTHSNVKSTLDVTTPFGFVRRFERPSGGNWECWDGFRIERQAFNTLIQSTAACIMYCALIAIEDKLKEGGYRSQLICTVHDSLMIDVYPGELTEVAELVKKEMANPYLYGAMELTVPLGVDIEVGKNWGELIKMP